ncbi:MAG: hypothetical protein H7070_12930 [Saprospiraceae bacterium]|nr:hypothetical protein [Pyrinomonadaceae bacterium]
MKKIFNSVITLAFFIAPAFAQDEARISATWQVQKYDITASLPQNETDRSMTVKAKIDLKNVSARPASTLTLRIGSSAEISAVNINGSAVDFTKGEEKVNSATSLQRVVIRIPSVQSQGNLSAVVDYKLTVKENSGLSAVSPAGSQFLPTSFWYPTPNSWYFARGADYAPFRLTVNSSSGQSVISSGRSEAANTFDQKLGVQPMFVSGSWDAANVEGISVHYLKGSGAEEQKRAVELAALAAEAKAFTAKLLGNAPDVPIRIVSMKRGGGFSSGGTIFVDDSVFRRSKIDSQTAMNVADAVAKIWLGNSIAVNGDGYGVIREGLTKFIATQFLESKYGKDIADVERLRQRTAYAAVAARDSPLNIVSPLDDYYYPEVANKGAMIWRILVKKVGQDEFFNTIRTNAQDGSLSLTELRSAFSPHKEFLDHALDQVTETNLQAGLPQVAGGETKIALRNAGGIDTTVTVTAALANGEKMSAPTTIKAKSYGEVIFKTTAKVMRVEIDSEKLYPQTNYSDDVAPREVTDSDLLLGVKRAFDKQEFANAESVARIVLREFPRFDDVRVLLARSLLAQGKNADAEKDFRAILDEKLPSSRSIAWANVGLGEISAKNGQNAQAVKFAEEAIQADAEYGASLAARAVRKRSNTAPSADESVKAFFAQFDRSAVSNRKAELDAMAVPGETAKFVSGISGQTVEWKTDVLYVDKIDSNTVLVETALAIKLLNREPETGTAVFRLSKVGNAWKLSAVDIFEVR